MGKEFFTGMVDCGGGGIFYSSAQRQKITAVSGMHTFSHLIAKPARAIQKSTEKE